VRIKTGHYYVKADYPGISGFRDFTRKEECIVTAQKARSSRTYIVREYLATGRGQFRLANGRLPEYQPIAHEVEALRWLDENPFAEIIAVERGQS